MPVEGQGWKLADYERMSPGHNGDSSRLSSAANEMVGKNGKFEKQAAGSHNKS
jgi:hypothetical protein